MLRALFQILQDFAFQRGQFPDNDHDVDYETMRYSGGLFVWTCFVLVTC